MKVSAEKLNSIILENKKYLIRITNILNEKRRILEIYGYEEERETVEEYERYVESIKDTLRRCEKAQLLEGGNYNF